IPYIRRMRRGNVIYIEPKDLERKIAEGTDLLMIDIRPESDFYDMFGHIEGALNLPFEQFMVRLNETADRLAGFRETPVVLIGLRDENKVFLAYQAMKQKGFSDVSILNYGISQWLRQGLPTVERNAKKTI
ncbi:MAG: rhodanese-like domain-containing protein, partial [Alphaproteobacteria bacterium]